MSEKTIPEIMQPFPPEKQVCKMIRMLGKPTIWSHGAYFYDAVQYRGITYVDQKSRRSLKEIKEVMKNE